MQAMIDFFGAVGALLWGPWTFFVLMAAGILFTLWTKFVQYTALTHGVAVVRGKYDNPDDPGAINHFQALSAALSATVGLGNIGGVALAIGAGGPGALFWMWIIGFFGMALKTVEITLAMMYRNTDDPDNPHGGAMWVVDRVVGGKGGVWKPLAKIIGSFFCITLVISTITGGNMFQSWSVSDLTYTFWSVPRVVTGIVLAVIVGLVIVGGIKRIGRVAGRLVPLMCGLYLISALAVLSMNIGAIPDMLVLIVKSAFQSTEASGAFLGGTLGWAFSTGLRRALFSNEAGQGSAPIAHSAAKTGEAAREGIVGGMGPFIDTICICSVTALVILVTGTWNRQPLTSFTSDSQVTPAYAFEDSALADASADLAGNEVVVFVTPNSDPSTPGPVSADRLRGTVEADDAGDLYVEWGKYSAVLPPTFDDLDVMSAGETTRRVGRIGGAPTATRAVDDNGTPNTTEDDRPLWGLVTPSKSLAITPDNEFLWDHIDHVFTVVAADTVRTTDSNRHQLFGRAELKNDILSMRWETIASVQAPSLVPDTGLYRDYSGASLTAHAFDRQFPGLGKILVTAAAWLFAISTMISWSYYGEQGIIYMIGERFVLPYKLIFLALAIFAAVWITDTSDMERLMDLGTGAMLWSNIPIVLALGFLSVRCLDEYGRKLRSGQFIPHEARSVEDMVDRDDS